MSCRAEPPSFCLPDDDELKLVHEETQELSKRAETQAMWDRIAKRHAQDKWRARGCLDGSTSSLKAIDEKEAVEIGIHPCRVAPPTDTAVFVPRKTDRKTRIKIITDDVEIQRFYNAQREGTRSAQPIQIISTKTIMFPPFGETVIQLGCTFSMVKYDRDEPWYIECLAKTDGLLVATQIFDIDGDCTSIRAVNWSSTPLMIRRGSPVAYIAGSVNAFAEAVFPYTRSDIDTLPGLGMMQGVVVKHRRVPGSANILGTPTNVPIIRAPVNASRTQRSDVGTAH